MMHSDRFDRGDKAGCSAPEECPHHLSPAAIVKIDGMPVKDAPQTTGRHPSRSTWRSRQDGFTLLEVLIALIIFSIAFGAIASIFQTSLRQSTTAETLMDATAVAERQIARFGTELPLELGETSGVSPEGLSWSAKIELGSPPRENSDVVLYRITVDVGSGEEGQSHLTLETLRIGRPP